MARTIFKKYRFEANTGFGASASTQGDRLIRKDGTYNVKRKGLSFSSRLNVYHELINMPWLKFVLIVVGSYTFINICFALIFMGVGMEEIAGDTGLTTWDHFWDAFFFSSQTLTTVGYGRTSPIGFMANLVAASECLVGLMSFAIITGLLYARFSRPRAKLVYSRNALIAPYKELNALMFRIANGRRNQLIECEAQVLLSYVEPNSTVRRFISLELEFKKVNALALSWTIVHPINNESPLYGLSLEDFTEMEAEFIFIFKGFDDTYSQTVHTRHSYIHHELKWGARFLPMYHRSEDGEGTILDMDKIGSHEPIELNIYISKNTNGDLAEVLSQPS